MKRITIGRHPDNDIVINYPTVSGHHATVEIDDAGTIKFTDHSLNGTVINGSKINNTSYYIQKGDSILLASQYQLDWSLIIPEPSRMTQRWTQDELSRYGTDGQQNVDEQYNNDSLNYNPLPISVEEPHQYHEPVYEEVKMSFGEAIKNVFIHYADFSGRARRTEYWWFVLVNVIFYLIPYVNIAWAIGTLIPRIALIVRRLHDSNSSGWYILMAFIPVIGWIFMLTFLLSEGTKGDNEYGPDPRLREIK